MGILLAGILFALLGAAIIDENIITIDWLLDIFDGLNAENDTTVVAGTVGGVIQ